VTRNFNVIQIKDTKLTIYNPIVLIS
jgi:hypothetical protein